MRKVRRWGQRDPQGICTSISKHLVAVIVPSNLMRAEGLLSTEDFICPETKVTAVDFSHGPIPVVCATASFDLTFDVSLGIEGMADWEDNNDRLSEAVVFR